MKVPELEKDRKILELAVSCLSLYSGSLERGARGNLWGIVTQILPDFDEELGHVDLLMEWMIEKGLWEE